MLEYAEGVLKQDRVASVLWEQEPKSLWHCHRSPVQQVLVTTRGKCQSTPVRLPRTTWFRSEAHSKFRTRLARDLFVNEEREGVGRILNVERVRSDELGHFVREKWELEPSRKVHDDLGPSRPSETRQFDESLCHEPVSIKAKKEQAFSRGDLTSGEGGDADEVGPRFESCVGLSQSLSRSASSRSRTTRSSFLLPWSSCARFFELRSVKGA